jgi:DNA-binding beta-propeller fold protein YncE
MTKLHLTCFGQKLRRVCVVVAAVSLAALAGCQTPPGTIFLAQPDDPYWPAPPEPPRIRYLGEIGSDQDLKPARSFLENVGKSLFGKKPAQQMLSPYAVCTDGGDRLFVADSNAQVVHVFNLATREYQQWAPPDSDGALGRFSQPTGVAYDPAGRLIVADSVQGDLVVFDQQGKYLGRIGGEQLSRPAGIAVDPERGRLFVADVTAHQVVVMTLGGQPIRRLGTRGTELGEFNFPTNVAVDPSGRLYVSDTLNFRVQQFDADLKPVRQIGRGGNLPGYFAQPKGLGVDREGHLYVIDAHFEAVQVFDSQGRLLMTFGEEGRGRGQFWLPAGICVDSNNRIWIADTYNRRVQVFDYLGEDKP